MTCQDKGKQIKRNRGMKSGVTCILYIKDSIK